MDKPLSPRELETLKLAAAGWGQNETAAQFGVKSDTVKMFRLRLKAKLGATTLPEAVAIAMRLKLIE